MSLSCKVAVRKEQVTNMFNNTTFPNITNSTNGTAPTLGARPPQLPVDVVANIVFCLLSLMIVFGNSLVIGAFRVNRRLRTKTNLLLFSLAVADLLIGTISVPLWVYISVKHISRGPLIDFYLIFDVICGVSSILNLTAISLERCYALLHPIKHRNIRKRIVLAVIFVAWILASFAGSMFEFLGVKNQMYYGITVTAAFFFLPLFIILGAYGTIFHIARAHARGRGVSSFKKDLRIATTVAVVIGLFVICWTPFFVLNFTLSLCKFPQHKSVCNLLYQTPVIFPINKWLQYGNSVCNPIIYGLRNKDFRRAFRRILLGLCCKKVPLSDFNKSTYGRTVRNTVLNRESSFENSRSVIVTPNVPAGMFDLRESYRKAIQSGRSKPIKLKFTKKTLADGLLALNMDAFHGLPSPNDFASTANLLSSSSEVSASPAELCNPAFEYDHSETDIYPIDQANDVVSDSSENITTSTNSLHKNPPKGSLRNGETARVHFEDSRMQEDKEDLKTFPSLTPAFDRKRSLSELLHRSNSDSLKQNLRSSFS